MFPKPTVLLSLAMALTGALAPPITLAQEASETERAMVQQAVALMNRGDLAGAIAVLEPEVQKPNAPVPLRGLLGALYVEASRPEDALTLLGPLAESPDADPAVLYNSGRAALALGDTGRAERYFAGSVAGAPGSPAARELGLIRGQQGRFAEAFVLLRPWVQNNPEDLEARMGAALCAVQLKRGPDAEELLSDLSQDNPRVRLLWGKVLILKGDPYGALSTLSPLLETALDPAVDMDVRRSMGQAQVLIGEGAQAVRLLEGRVDGYPAAALQLTHAQNQSGDLEGALETVTPYAQSLLANTAQGVEALGSELAAGIVLEYGRLLVSTGHVPEALPSLELATQLNPGDKQGWQSLGQALAATGKRDEAKVALDRFKDIAYNEIPQSVKDMQLRQDAEDPTGRQLREALKLRAQGRPEEGMRLVQQEMALAPDDVRPRLVEARILLDTGKTQEALESAEKAVELAPQNADAIYIRAVIRMALGNSQAAEQGFREALELAPNHPPAMNDLAVLLMNSGREEEATQLLQALVEIRPEDYVALENLKKLKGEE